MMDVERITEIVELNLKHQCQNQVYMIIVMHVYLLKGLYQSQQKKRT